MKGTTEARILTELQIALVLVFYEQLKNQKTVVYWSPEREMLPSIQNHHRIKPLLWQVMNTANKKREDPEKI